MNRRDFLKALVLGAAAVPTRRYWQVGAVLAPVGPVTLQGAYDNGGILTLEDIREAVEKLRRLNAEPPDGQYVVHMDPRHAKTLRLPPAHGRTELDRLLHDDTLAREWAADFAQGKGLFA